jgi:hypothetical protein
MPTFAVFQLYRGMNTFYKLILSTDFINTAMVVSLPPRYNCNTVESISKRHNLNPCGATNWARAGCTCFVERCLSFCTFSFYSVVLSVLLWYADCDYPFDIFRLFFQKQQQFEDTKLVIWSRNSTRGKSYHGQKTKQRMVDTLKVQKDKQRSTKHVHNTTDRATRTPLRTGDGLRCSGMVCTSKEWVLHLNCLM